MLFQPKENLVNPVSRIIESYVIKDLRSVETHLMNNLLIK